MAAQHPIPQQISSYEFRLVGDMTIKQFFQVGSGALVALLFYASPLPGFIKWPLVLLFSLAGVAMAFLPIEDRPLDRWIIAFFRAVYSPTRFIWKRGTEIDFFAPEEEGAKLPQIAVPTKTPEAAKEYLATVPQEGGRIISAFEQAEQTFFEKVLQLFQQVVVPKPKETVAPSPVVPPPPPAGGLRPRFVVEEEGLAGPQVKQTVTPTPLPQQWVQPAVTPHVVPKPMPFSPVLPGGGLDKARAAHFELSAAPPAPTDLPNIVVGQVVDWEGKILEGAILEIRDSEGRPVRALKTNKVGHFLIVTPLKNGIYEIETEKEGYVFDKVRFEARGEIVPPIEIRAREGTPVFQPNQ